MEAYEQVLDRRGKPQGIPQRFMRHNEVCWGAHVPIISAKLSLMAEAQEARQQAL